MRSRLPRRRSAQRAGPWLLPSDEAGSDASHPGTRCTLSASQQLDGRAQQGGHSVTSVWWGRRTRVPVGTLVGTPLGRPTTPYERAIKNGAVEALSAALARYPTREGAGLSCLRTGEG